MIGICDGWASHIPMLMAAFEATHGPVLELGAGHYSTPLLHSLCHATHRPLLTLESDGIWLAKFASLESDYHELRQVDDWNACQAVLCEQDWSLLFVDFSPSEQRADVLRMVLGSLVVVVHDAERKDGGLRDALGKFRHVAFDKPRARQPWTAAASHAPLPFKWRAA